MKTDRLVSIIMLLVDKKRVGARELADLFEVSPRTIYRDIDAINMAGIPVCSTRGGAAALKLCRNTRLIKGFFGGRPFRASDGAFDPFRGMMRGEGTGTRFAKVKSFIPAGRAKDIELK